jgi:outer membrane protein insertion porin family
MAWTLDTILLLSKSPRYKAMTATRALLCLVVFLFSFSLFAKSKVVIQLRGESLSAEEVKELSKELGLSTGKELDLKQIEEGIRSLSKSGKYQRLKVETEEKADGLIVYLSGARLHKINALTFGNIDNTILEQARARLNIQQGSAVDQKTLDTLQDYIRAGYTDKGYLFAEVKVKSQLLPESDSVNVEIDVVSNEPTVISKINIRGAAQKENDEILASLPIQRGDVFTKEVVDRGQEAIQRYFQDNQYPTSKVDETTVNFSEDKLKVELTYLLKMGDRFQFEFSGNTVYEEALLRELITEETLSQVEPSKRVAELIESKYRAAGFHFVKVIPEEISPKGEKLRILRLKIEEGERVIIDRFEISGGNPLSESELEDLLIEEAPGVLARKLYWEEKIPEMLEKFLRKLEKKGFLHPSVSGPRTVFSDDKKGVQLIMDVELGVQTFITRIDTEGNKSIARERILEALPFEVGEPLDREKLEDGRNAVLDVFRKDGFVDVKWTKEAEEKKGYVLSSDQREAVIRLLVDEGQQYFVGEVSVEGNRKTKSQVILREMELKTGDKFDPFAVQRSDENINILGLFSRVEILTVTSSVHPNRKDIKVLVVEYKPGSGELGLGGAYEAPRFRLRNFFSMAYRNIAGTNQTASTRAEVAIPFSHKGKKVVPFVEYGVLLGYRSPYPLGLPLTFVGQAGLDGYELSTNADGTRSDLQYRARIEEKIEKRFSKKVTFLYRLHRFELTNNETQSFVDLGPNDEPLPKREVNIIGSTGPGLIVDFRNDIFNPTRGSYHTLDVELAHPYLLSRENTFFIMTTLRNSFYLPLPDPFSFSFFGGAGYARSLNRDTTVAPQDQALPRARRINELALGGQGSIRGYSSKKFRPQDDAIDAAYYNLRFELGMKLSAMLQNLSMAVFFDSGQIFSAIPGKALQTDPRQDGYGFGFRYKTPVGPLVIDIAQGVGDTKENVKFSLTVGTF